MIKIEDKFIHIATNNTSYVFCITPYGDLQHLHYGGRVADNHLDVLKELRSVLLVNTLYPDGDESYGIDGTCFEYSFANRGNSSAVGTIMSDKNGGVFDFVFSNAKIGEVPPTLAASSHGYDNTLVVIMKDKCRNVMLELWYLVYENVDVITRFARVINCEKEDISIHKLMSAQLDIFGDDFELTTFDGAWGRERIAKTHTINSGSFLAGSHSGMSGAECNPFFMIKDKSAGCNCDDVFAFNLVYSGSHQFSAERNPYGVVSVMNGIQSDGFLYKLQQGQNFVTPESVMTFSCFGTNGVSQNMHAFVQKHITRYVGQLPVMLNSWEAMYFDITEQKVMAVIDGASELGFEAVVVDDGWFKNRHNDTLALGDWVEDKNKFPNGIVSVANYCKSKDMIFGIWIEPEMISVDSDLYRANPTWALMTPKAKAIVGRNQYILDLTKTIVQDYIVEAVGRLVEDYGIGYLKWDFNRRLSDICCDDGSQSYHYRYTLSLYQIMERITKKYPKLIIEGCASGGGRFDLGMLCYCPFVWVSDNTDPLSRAEIQEGTSYGYPMNVMLNHISASPNHQTERSSKIKSRLDIAHCGAFGAQLDPNKLCKEDKQALSDAIKVYKNDRVWLENCKSYRLSNGQVDNHCIWQIMSKDGDYVKLVIFKKRFYTVDATLKIKLKGLDDDALYEIFGEGLTRQAYGLTLKNGGFVLPQNYQGVKYEESTGRIGDSGTAVYYIKKKG